MYMASLIVLAIFVVLPAYDPEILHRFCAASVDLVLKNW